MDYQVLEDEMRILVTNDDGIYSPGLRALSRAAAEFGEVRVVAPDVEQSSSSHSITSTRPLWYRPVSLDGMSGFRVNGTPADCVALGTHNWEKVDVVLSGINLGPNIGNALWHSGTLAAAKQAVLLGTRGIALSTPAGGQGPDFERLAPYVSNALALLLKPGMPALLNVNFPREPRGMAWTRQSVRHYNGWVVPGEDPMGRKHFWFTVRPIEETEEGTDLWAMQNGLTSITPLRLDLTNESELARVQREAQRQVL
jgi:5'-nucleotidase